MKVKALKLTPELFKKFLLQEPTLSENLPKDIELVDLKLDLLSNQIIAVLRSDQFSNDASDLVNKKEPLPPKETSANKTNTQCTSIHKLSPCKIAESIKKEFSQYHRVLNFSINGKYIIATPTHDVGSQWGKIDKLVKEFGGKWIESQTTSFWEMPIL
jgi:hypothetical protein